MVVRALICCALMMVTGHVSADVTAHLSADFIDELESVRLVIRATGTRQSEVLDLSALEHDFHVMGTNTSSQYQYINGREESWVDYQITLQPKRTGALAIPRIKVGSEQTNPLQLIVQPIARDIRRKIDELVFFENELSSSRAYVQAQIVVTRRLLYSSGVQLYSEIPGAPEIPDAVVLVLGETKSGQTMRNGKRYGMVEQRFAIFPEASGELVVPSISLTASVRIVDGGRVSRKGVRVGTEPLVATVLPVPASYPRDEPWLPAEAVTVSETWSPELAAGVDVGDTLERRLVVRVHGNTGSIAPPLGLTLDTYAFRQYPQTPSIEDDTRGESVLGIRTETVSVVPQIPGLLTVPAERITWWDTVSDELRVTELGATTMDTAGASIRAETGTAEVATDAAVPSPDTVLEERPPPRLPLAENLRWMGLALGVLLVAGVLYRFRHRVRLPQLHAVRRRSGPSLGTLTAAAATRDARAVKKALVAFTGASGIDAPELMHLLNRYLYRDDVTALSDGDTARVNALIEDLQRRSERHAEAPRGLPPLYSS